MAREDRLVETLVTLADTLVDHYDIIDFLQTLAERCVDLVDVSAAGIMLADPQSELRHAACSNEQMRLVELFELQVEEGPVLRRVPDAGAGDLRLARRGRGALARVRRNANRVQVFPPFRRCRCVSAPTSSAR